MRLDRIVTLVFLIAITQGFLLVFDPSGGIFSRTIDQNLTGPLTLVILSALVVITIGIADAVVRSHPQSYLLRLPAVRIKSNKFEFAPFSWVLPGLLVVGSYLFMRLFGDPAIQVTGTIISSILILGVIIAQYYSVGRQERFYGWAVIGLNVAAYVAGFLIFSSIYVNKWRALQSAPLVGLTGMLLTYELLHQTKTQSRSLVIYCAVIGVVLAEVTWALNYWLVSVLVGGIVPLLICYVLIGIMQAHLTKNLNKSVAREYLLVSIFSIALVTWAVLANLK